MTESDENIGETPSKEENNNVFMISNHDRERGIKMTTLWIIHLNKLCIYSISIINLIESLTL